MADNRKYYYLKLKENFFDSDSIVLLEDMKDGILYSNILLKLYLKSLKNGGRLQLDEHIPYTAQMIATLTRHQIGTVERALSIFQQLGLVEQLDCGLLYMTDIYYVIIKYVQKLLNKNVHMVSSKTYQGGLKMILKTNIITNLEINGLEDLHKLKPLMEHTNINRSQIARELGVDRRTVDKYINGFKKSEHRTSSNCLSNYQEKIRELLDDENDQVFYYRRNLWRYLVDNEGYTGSYPNFCGYLKKIPEFDSYFRKRRPGNGGKFIRYETEAGHQAQLDWKESMKLLTTDLGWIEVNIFVLILSFSRFRVYRMTFSRSQDILFSLLDDAFDTFGGIPDEILTDNMKTVMDEPRTKGSPGKVNPRFRQFADDYGFDVRPCVAATPRTKGKVESPMRILDELRAYNGRLDYMGFVNMLSKINDRENGKVHPTTGRIPVMYLDKERESFHKLPKDSIRTPYRMVDKRVKADNSSLFRYKGKLYSVPPEYIGLELTLQVHDGYLHVYSSTKLVALHAISDKGINYNEGHYEELIRSTHSFAEENIGQRAKENLKAIGALYE